MSIKSKLSIILCFLLVVISGCNKQSVGNRRFDNAGNCSVLIDDGEELTQNLEGTQGMATTCSIFVDGEIVDNTYAIIYQKEKYAEIPLLAVTEAMGAKVIFLEPAKAVISYNEVQYLLDIEQHSLKKELNNSFVNYLAPPPGETVGLGARFIENEFYISNYVARRFISELGSIITVDYNREIVFIDSRSAGG